MFNYSECADFPCFKQKIDNKGFSFAELFDENGTKVYRFESDMRFTCSSNPNVNTKNMSSYTKYEDGDLGASLGTSFKPHYLAIISDLDSLGFKVTASEDIGGEKNIIMIRYQSQRYPSIVI